MTVYKASAKTIPSKPGFYQTSFFVNGPYQPQTGGNNAAQFCRNCHGGEAERNAQFATTFRPPSRDVLPVGGREFSPPFLLSEEL